MLSIDSVVLETSDGQSATSFGPNSYIPNGLKVTVTTSPNSTGTVYNITAENISGKTLKLKRLKFNFKQKVIKALENGLQSFSSIRVTTPDDYRPERLKNSTPFLIKMHHGDWEQAGKILVSDLFSALKTTNGSYLFAGWLGSDLHLSTVEITSDQFALVAVLDDMEISNNEIINLSPFWISESSSAYENYLELLGKVLNARNNAPTHFGWCSWYHFFSDITFNNIKDVIRLDAKHLFDVIQVDDGYQAQIGNWLEPSKTFEGIYPGFEQYIKDHGYQAGIWTAPFLVTEKSSIYKQHPDWLVRDSSGNPVLAMYSPTNWGGNAYALDTTNPEVLTFIFDTFKALKQLGFSYFKCDFLYAAILPGIRQNSSISRAQSLINGLKAIREAIGDDFLLGCGCPFGPAIGHVDAIRVSPDTAPFFEERIAPFGYKETGPAAKNAIMASILRAPMHRRLWINDPDCLLIRPTEITLDNTEKQMLLATVLGSSGFVMVSDDLNLYGPDEFKLLETIKELISLKSLDSKMTIKDLFDDELTIESDTHSLKANFSQKLAFKDYLFGGIKDDFSVILLSQ